MSRVTFCLSALLWLLFAVGCASAPADGGREAVTGSSSSSAAAESCSMGFAELFELARGRPWTDEEVRGFQALDQPGKNAMVRQLAAEAGGIRTEDQVGSDGVVYTAFWRESSSPAATATPNEQ